MESEKHIGKAKGVLGRRLDAIEAKEGSDAKKLAGVILVALGMFPKDNKGMANYLAREVRSGNLTFVVEHGFPTFTWSTGGRTTSRLFELIQNPQTDLDNVFLPPLKTQNNTFIRDSRLVTTILEFANDTRSVLNIDTVTLDENNSFTNTPYKRLRGNLLRACYQVAGLVH